MGARYFGAAVRRREDPRFLRGEARYVDDVTLPGMLHAAFLRAPHAHARLARIDTVAAKALAGVAAVFTFDDLARWMKPLPLFGAPPPGLPVGPLPRSRAVRRRGGRDGRGRGPRVR